MSEHPRRFTLPAADQADNHTYFTPGWIVRMWADLHKPAMPHRVVDPCAGDGRIGLAFSAFALLDLVPRAEGVKLADFLELTREHFGGIDASFVINPPFNLAREFVEKALELAGDDGDVCVLMRCGVLQQVGWPWNPVMSYLPKRRVSFEITAEYAAELDEQAIRKGRKPSHSRADCPTGWKLGSPGDDHGIFVFRNGHQGPCETHYVDVTKYLEG